MPQMTTKRLLLLLLIFLPVTCWCQELSYTHYDMKEGLAGSTVYAMVQDKDGFLWFATESGVSRFDGTRFTNYTTNEGLSDNEVLQLFVDSKGRVWMAPFKKSVCYYYKGRIHNQENDSLLAKMEFQSNIVSFSEDKQGAILMQQQTGLLFLFPDNTTRTLNRMDDDPLVYFCKGGINAVGNFTIVEKATVYEWNGERFNATGSLNRKLHNAHPLRLDFRGDNLIHELYAVVYLYRNGKTKVLTAIPTNFVNLQFLNDSIFFASTPDGAYFYHLDHPESPVKYLHKKHVTRVIYDREGSLWFATIGEGVFRLNSEVVENVTLISEYGTRMGVFALLPLSGKVMVGAELGNIYHAWLRDKNVHVEKVYRIDPGVAFKKVMAARSLKNGDLIVSTDLGFFKFKPDYTAEKFSYNVTVKSIVPYKGTDLLLATINGAIVFDPYAWKIKDTLWKERTTDLYYRNDTTYIGTINGLYLLVKGKPAQYWGATIPSFRFRIAAFTETPDGVLWIATYGDGVLGYKDGSIVRRLTTETGLTSNTARCLYADSCYLWIGTDKGLNKINTYESNYPIKKYSTSDGLASDVIYTVYAAKNNIFIGTPYGLTWFDENKISSTSRCDLYITGISVSDRPLSPDTTRFILPASNHHLRIDFAGISFRSAGDVLYWYRLSGLDSTWRTTRETFLSYPSLPAGNYDLQLQAVNKFGIASSLVTIPFSVDKLLWKQSWFQLSVAASFLLLLWLWTSYRIRRVRRQEIEKLVINKRINELEQLALKAQMNPHFIFNSLNSIQHYVIDKDIAGANKFISTFSKLIRQTLYYSSRSSIPLSEEIQYLTTYLALEKDRLEGKFDYQIQVADSVPVSDIHIPPMILQPYLENSVRHGIRYRKDKEGLIIIRMMKEKGYLVCVIEDNGVGRLTTSQFNSKNAVEYQSKGMSLTADRIAMMNKDSTEKIRVSIDDLTNTAMEGIGTRITVRFPVL